MHGSHGLSARSARLALLLTVGFRFAYSTIAAIFGFYLPVNWKLVHSNALTENLPPPSHSTHYLFLGIWERFDTLWYLRIANRGYDRPDALVFYPLYPFLIRVASRVMSSVAAALLVPTVASFFAVWGLQKLLQGDLSAESVRRVLILCMVWPAAFIFFAGYPESVLLACILWSLYFAREDRWIFAAAAAIAGELVKAAGVVVIVPLLIMAFRRRAAKAWPVLLTPLGALVFPLCVTWSRHQTIQSIYQVYWRTANAAPWTTLCAASQSLLLKPNLILVLNIVFLIVVCVFVWLSRIGLEYKLYGAAAIVLFLCKQTNPALQSMMRYLIIVFPAYVGLAQVMDNPRWQPRFWMVASSLMVINLAWMWLFLGWSLIL